MAWDNDENGTKKGPWGKRSTKPQMPDNGDEKPRGQSEGEAPDIDALLKQAQEKFGGFFGGGPGNDEKKGFGLIALVLLALWLGTGFYRVLPEENAVILTFGKWTSTRGESGLGYSLPWPIQTVMKVNVAFDRRVEVGFRDAPGTGKGNTSDVASESQMLTGDENIVDIDFVVTWRVSDAKNYLFNIRDPETTVKKVAESALREIVGRDKIQRALTEGLPNARIGDITACGAIIVTGSLNTND